MLPRDPLWYYTPILKEKLYMKSRIAKTFSGIAAILAAIGAWADTTVSAYRNRFETAETFTFSTLVVGSTYVWIGSAATTDNPFEEGWAVWVSQDGTENCGINQTADHMWILFKELTLIFVNFSIDRLSNNLSSSNENDARH